MTVITLTYMTLSLSKLSQMSGSITTIGYFFSILDAVNFPTDREVNFKEPRVQLSPVQIMCIYSLLHFGNTFIVWTAKEWSTGFLDSHNLGQSSGGFGSGEQDKF